MLLVPTTCARELLHEVALLVGALGGGDEGEGVGAVLAV